jgi:hypothetical protein
MYRKAREKDEREEREGEEEEKMDLHTACFLGHRNRVESLLAVVNVNSLQVVPQTGEEKETPLAMAVKGGHFDVCDLLLQVHRPSLFFGLHWGVPQLFRYENFPSGRREPQYSLV